MAELNTHRPTTSVELAQRAAVEVFALRCLQQRTPLKLQLLPEERFQDAREAVQAAYTKDSIWPTHRAGWIGLYDPTTQMMSVLDRRVESDDERRKMAFVLAHEIEHAVQHQYLSVPASRNLDFDAALALRAVLEGDASFVAEAYVVSTALRGGSQSVPTDRVLEWLARKEAEGATAELMRERTDALQATLHQVSTSADLFSYADGLTFVASVYLHGGFEAIDRVLARPPVSTEQVLHPEKFFSGERPVQIRAPAKIAAELETLRTQTVGEVGIRLLLAQCIDQARANASARDWGGDRLTLLGVHGELRQVVWSTVWDSIEAAQRFSAVLHDTALCACHGLANDTEAFDVAVRSKATRVTLACGSPDADLATVAQKLLVAR